MDSRYDYCWCNTNTKTSEVILLKLTFSVTYTMFCNYILPFVKRIYPSITAAISNIHSPSKFIENKRYIASHVKSVYEKVKIYVVTDPELCNNLVENRMLGKNNIKFIGLDCEWESSKKNGVALIQISSGNDCILYRTIKAGGVIPDNLKLLLEDNGVLKFGVAIQEDVRRLHFHGVHVKGFVDLRNLAQRCLPIQRGNQNCNEEEDVNKWTSLRSLSFNALDLRLNKSYHVRCSNWEVPILTPSQILYAAKDAIVSLEIFYALVLLRKVNRQSVSVLISDSFNCEVESAKEWVKQHAWDHILLNMFIYCHKSDQLLDMDISLLCSFNVNKPSDWLVDLAHSLCQGIINVNHRCRPPVNFKNRMAHPLISNSRNISTKAKKVKDYGHQCRSKDKPLYENCFLLGPDDKVLATVNKAKVSWYVEKNLGEITCEDPFTVKLFFEPSGKPQPDADYYTTIKDNVCVVCEGTDSFVRKNIIPHDYRRYFPLPFKDHMSHDILLMCIDCHRLAQLYDDQHRQELAAKYNAPFGTSSQRLFINNPELSKVKSAAKALHLNGSKIPEARAVELKSIIQKYYGSNLLTDEIIYDFAVMNTKIKNENYCGSHGERVVNAVVQENTLSDFIRQWRQHFLSTMKPIHLPPLWSVEHNLDKLLS